MTQDDSIEWEDVDAILQEAQPGAEILLEWRYTRGKGGKTRSWVGVVTKGYKGGTITVRFPPGLPDFLPTTGATIRWPEPDSRQRCTITRCTLREPATPCVTPTRKKHRPLEDAEEEEQEEEQVENEEDEEEELTPVKTKKAKPTQNPKKRAPEKRPRDLAMAVRELMRLDEDGDSEEDNEAGRVLDRLEAQRHQLMWTGPDGVSFPAHPAPTPEMKWAYAHAWVGGPVADWVAEFRNYMRYTQSVHRMELSRSGHQMIAHLENSFVLWLGTTTASSKMQRQTAVGQAILEAILLQAVLARNGPDGVIECCEALAEARGKGKIILSSLIKKIKAQKPDYTSKKWEGKFEKKKENSSDKKVHFKKWDKRGSRESDKKGHDFRKKRQ
jgi:hypothetical protein